MTESIVGIGIIGCGWVTENAHCPALEYVSSAKIQVVYDVLPEQAQMVARQFSVPCVANSVEQLLEDKRVDAVLIATPADSHPTLATMALQAGKHVLCEKPLSVDVASANVMLDAAKSSDCVHMVGLNYRFHPLAQALKAQIDAGSLGKVHSIFSTMITASRQRSSVSGYEADPSRGGGVLQDKVVHALDLVAFFGGAAVQSTNAIVNSRYNLQDEASVQAVLENGVHNSGYYCDHACPDCSFTVIGDLGKAEINLTRPAGVQVYLRKHSSSKLQKGVYYLNQFAGVVSAIGLATRRGRLASYSYEWQYFLDCIRQGRQASPSFSDGLALVKVVSQLTP
jgi:predicted dehydrogenase